VTLDGSRPFFQVPNNELYGGIRINLAGREPRGFVEAGPAYEATLDMLTEELLQLADPATGRPLVKRVLRSDDLHPGPRRSWLPDLLVDWERSAPITAATSPTIGLVTGSYDGVRSGDHRPSGLVTAMGPGIEAGGRAGAVRMWDLAPTICETLGVELPGADGDVVPALVADQR
jgi:predicted AlkP superfamily phosphohydrolase/phosphomutase